MRTFKYWARGVAGIVLIFVVSTSTGWVANYLDLPVLAIFAGWVLVIIAAEAIVRWVMPR